MKLHEIKEQRAVRVTEMRTLLNAGDKLTPEAQTKFDSLKTQVIDLDGQEARATFLEAQERAMLGQGDNERRDHANLEHKVSITRILQSQLEGRNLTGADLEYAQEAERRTGRKAQGIFVPLSVFEKRANTTSTATNLVGTEHRPDQYIQPLRNALLARQLGVRVLSGLRGNITVPKYGSGLSAGWVAEGGALSSTDMGFDSVTLSPKHAGGITEMSRQLIQQASPDIEMLIRDDLSFALAKAIDAALITGGGTHEPTGLLSTSGIQTASLSTLTWPGILAMIEKSELANAGVVNWLTHPKVKTHLAGTLKGSSAGCDYLLEDGLMANMPLYSSNQVLAKTGTPNTGRLILGDWSQVMLGIWSEVDLLVNPFDSAAYARGGVLVRAMATMDIAVRHPEAFIVADDVVL